jgi:16S rRNA (guanine1207-N2)-methyltransferase
MAHYYSENQESKFVLKKIKASLRGRDFEFFTAPGIFSGKKVDSATELLINNAVVQDGWRILDLGCGYGPVGVSLRKLFDIKVVMTDINKRAVQLSKMNLKLNKIEAEVFGGNLFENITGKFSTILLNPPMAAGRKLCFEMIEKSTGFLEDGGLLQIVARHNKGGKMLEEKMKEVFGNVKETARREGFRVYVSENIIKK